MKVKYRMLNLSAVLRLLLVGLLSVGGTYIITTVASNTIDLIYRATDHSQFWMSVFYTLSQYRAPLAFLLLLLGLVLFGGWVLAPIFSNYAEVVADSLRPEEDAPEVKLPGSLKALETRINDINKEMRLWRYAVREAEQRKDDLVVYLAHDIRTPLTSILGYLELVTRHPELPEQSRMDYTEIALRKAERMQVLVEELFEITRFNVSRIELDKREVNAAVFINQLAEEAAPMLAERNIRMSVENNGDESLFIDGDKVARAVENILQNAARYTPEGERVGIRLETAEEGRCRISIYNTGQEISQDKLNRFFEKFYRGDEARQSATGGAGLGLAIARNLIEAHGGTLTAENKDRITTFTILI